MILHISNVMAEDHLLTPTERALKRVPCEIVLLLAWLTISVATNLFREGFHKMSFIPLIPATLIGIVIAIDYFRGVLYIRSFNHAFTNGVHYEGCVVESVKETSFGSPRGRSYYYRALIQIDGIQKIRTPVYRKFSSSYKYCDVYYYKKKYYFCAFRMYKDR